MNASRVVALFVLVPVLSFCLVGCGGSGSTESVSQDDLSSYVESIPEEHRSATVDGGFGDDYVSE
ncbi:hypothetical protein [Planctomycetes bacterium CA13]